MKQSSHYRKIRSTATPAELAHVLRDLHHQDRAALIYQWNQLYGTAPPRGISQALMIRAIAYRMQEEALGKLKLTTQRQLTKAYSDAATEQTNVQLPKTVKPGTRLLREWHGVTHEVIVMQSGVQWDGKHYRSLSEVARLITGTRWSGPLFFGLKKAVRKRAI